MLRVERLSPRHAVDTFASGNTELDGWLHRAGLTADRAGTARVYVWIDDDELAGYFAIAPHAMLRDNVPASVGRGSPVMIPAFVLARLALSRTRQGLGQGRLLLGAALSQVLHAIRMGGGRIVVVDAIDDNASRFYQLHGFRSAVDSPNRLVMKASFAAASVHVEWP